KAISIRSPQPEFHRDFHQHVHRHALARRRVERPLLHRLDGALVEPVAEPAQLVDAADRAVALTDDLHQHVAAQVPPARLFRVVRLHLATDRGRLDAAARPEWPAASAAAFSLADARALAFADSGACAGSHASLVA